MSPRVSALRGQSAVGLPGRNLNLATPISSQLSHKGPRGLEFSISQPRSRASSPTPPAPKQSKRTLVSPPSPRNWGSWPPGRLLGSSRHALQGTSLGEGGTVDWVFCSPSLSLHPGVNEPPPHPWNTARPVFGAPPNGL